MGTVFVAVAGQHGNNAENFYTMFPAESVLPNQQILTTDHIKRVSSPSLYTLLRAIIRHRDREIVVVSHGSPTQLAIRVMPGMNIGLDLNFINAVLGSDSNANLAQRLGTNARNIGALRSRIQRVQQLRLSRLEFRACRVGQNQRMLEALKRLFGASAACAPKAFDGYGRLQNVRPTTDAAILTQWQSAHPRHEHFGVSPNRFFWVNNGNQDPPVISDVYAESWAAVRAWAEAKFPSGRNHHLQHGTFYYHIQTNILANSSSVHGRRTFENNFVFPNDSGYRQNLVQVRTSPPLRPASIPQSAPQGRGPIGLNTRYAAFDVLNDELMLSPQQHSQNHMPGPEGMIT